MYSPISLDALFSASVCFDCLFHCVYFFSRLFVKLFMHLKNQQNNKPHSIKSINCYSHEWMHDAQKQRPSLQSDARCAPSHHTSRLTIYIGMAHETAVKCSEKSSSMCDHQFIICVACINCVCLMNPSTVFFSLPLLFFFI